MKPLTLPGRGRVKPACLAPRLLLAALFLTGSLHSGEWRWQHPLPLGETVRAVASAEGSTFVVGDCGTLARTGSESLAWQPVETDTLEDLKAVAWVAPKTWVVAGSAGAILRSTDSGASWTVVSTGEPPAILWAVAFGAPEAGLAAGSEGTILGSRDGGRSWSRRDSGVNTALRGIAFLGPREAVVVGERGVILQTRDAGETWTKRRVESDLHGVAVMGDEVIAVGGEIGYFRNQRAIFRSSDRGTTWQNEARAKGPVLYGIAIASDQSAFACGEAGALYATDGPRLGWRKLESPTKHLLAAVAHAGDKLIVSGSFGVTLSSTDAGQTWASNYARKQKRLNSISFADRLHGVAVGEEGLILHTTDGGATWQPSKSDFKASLLKVSTLQPRVAVAVGGEGLVLRTGDGGASWEALVAGPDVYLAGLDFIDENTGVAVGYSAIMATHDGGRTWVRRPLPAGLGDFYLSDVAYGSASVIAAVDYLGMILTSVDGGNTWTERLSRTGRSLQAVAWSDAQHATAVGDKGMIMRTEDGGVTWRQTPSGTSHRLTGVAYLNEREGFACGLQGTLLFTPDGGQTWRPERSHTRNHLQSLFCRPGTPAFVCGWNATVLRHDPTPAAIPP